MPENDNDQTKIRPRRIPRIVFERPVFDRNRFVLFTLCGILAGLLVGVGLSLAGRVGATPDQVAPEKGVTSEKVFPAAYEPAGTLKFIPSAVVIGVLAGLGLGWGWKRSVTPRIEMVEVSAASRPMRPRARPAMTRGLQRVPR